MWFAVIWNRSTVSYGNFLSELVSRKKDGFGEKFEQLFIKAMLPCKRWRGRLMIRLLERLPKGAAYTSILTHVVYFYTSFVGCIVFGCRFHRKTIGDLPRNKAIC